MDKVNKNYKAISTLLQQDYTENAKTVSQQSNESIAHFERRIPNNVAEYASTSSVYLSIQWKERRHKM